jgi:hypothetical protein
MSSLLGAPTSSQTPSFIAAATSAQLPLPSASSTVPCSVPVLPASIQQLLTGQSFENLKNILASVSKKPDSSVHEAKNESMVPTADMNVAGIVTEGTPPAVLNAMINTTSTAAAGWPTGVASYLPMVRSLLPMQADPTMGLSVPPMFNAPMLPMMMPFRPDFMHSQQGDLRPPNSDAVTASGYRAPGPTSDVARAPRPLLPTPAPVSVS